MKIKEDFIKRGYNPLLSDWGHGLQTLKYEYTRENSSEVKTYKLNKREFDQYLKTGELPKRIGN